MRKTRISASLWSIVGCFAFLFVLGCEEVGFDGSIESDDSEFEDRAASVGHTSNTLIPGGQLKSNEYLQSKNGAHRLVLQSDGNLVLKRMSDNKALWSQGKSATQFKLQKDGNLVLKTASGSAVWSSKTAGSGATKLYLHSAGQLVLYKDTKVVWSADGAPTSDPPEDPGPSTDQSTDTSADSGTKSTLLVHDGSWKYVYCSGSAVKVSSSSSKKQRWVKRNTRQLYNETVKKYLYCPERDGGYAPTNCTCSDRAENYHTKTSATGGSAPATIPTNRDMYIAPNNNMNACFKVIRGDQIHSPCAIEPWRNQTCRKDNGDSFSSSEHALPCNKFRLND
jgi:hypothetical protein